MNCPNCGAEVTSDMRFCTSCGTQLSQVEQPQPATQPQPEYQPFQPQVEAQPVYQPQADPQQAYQQATQPQQPYQQVPPAANDANLNSTIVMYEGAVYPMSSTDRTLRLLNFIFCCISIAVSCWAIIPLAWMIPMTIISWGIYKGKKRNTVAFGVCTLIFTNLVGGILLLCSRKDD